MPGASRLIGFGRYTRLTRQSWWQQPGGQPGSPACPAQCVPLVGAVPAEGHALPGAGFCPHLQPASTAAQVCQFHASPPHCTHWQASLLVSAELSCAVQCSAVLCCAVPSSAMLCSAIDYVLQCFALPLPLFCFALPLSMLCFALPVSMLCFARLCCALLCGAIFSALLSCSQPRSIPPCSAPALPCHVFSQMICPPLAARLLIHAATGCTALHGKQLLPAFEYAQSALPYWQHGLCSTCKSIKFLTQLLVIHNKGSNRELQTTTMFRMPRV